MTSYIGNSKFRVGALVVLAVCFGMSAVFRAGDVIAGKPGSGGDDGFGNPIAQPAPDKPVDAEASQDPMTPSSSGSVALAVELKRQRAALEKREAEMAAREQKLKALSKHMERRLEELEAARERLSATVSGVSNAANKDVERLAQMYQQMKPKKAGQIFNEMDPSFAAGFIAEMRPEAAALVMSNMDAEKAYAVSLLLAGRNLRPAQPVAAPTAPDN